jgi:hypothetical protein
MRHETGSNTTDQRLGVWLNATHAVSMTSEIWRPGERYLIARLQGPPRAAHNSDRLSTQCLLR